MKNFYAKLKIYTLHVLVFRIINLAFAFYSIGICVKNIGTFNFGIYAAFSSLIVLLGFLDFGLPNASIRLLSIAKTNGKTEEVGSILNSLFLGLFMQVLLLIILFSISYVFDFFRFLSPNFSIVQNENHWLIITFFFSIICSSISQMAQKVLLGLSDINASNILGLSISALSTLGILVGSYFSNTVPAMLIGSFVLPSLLSIFAFYRILKFFPDIQLGRLKSINPSVFISFIRNARLFFLVQGLSSAGIQFSTLAIFKFSGSNEAALFFATWKIFSVPASLTLFHSQPLWPNVASLIAKEEAYKAAAEVRRKLFYSAQIGVLVIILSFFCGVRAIEIWTGGLLEIKFPFIFIFSLNTFLVLLLQPISFALNGLHLERAILIFNLSHIGFTLLGLVFWVQENGALGAISSIALANLLALLIPSAIILNRRLNLISVKAPKK